jgi:hypothetical protein
MMKRSICPAIVLCLSFTVVCVRAVEAADLSGGWALEFQRDSSSPLYQAECTFKQEGNRLAGSCLSGFESIVPVRGRVEGTNVTFQLTIGVDAGTSATFSGRLDSQEASITGTWRYVDQQGDAGEGTFTATKR